MTSYTSKMDPNICGVNKFNMKDLIQACNYNYQASNNNNLEMKSSVDLGRVTNGNSPFIWLLGPPGTGKRTQGAMITYKLNFIDISVPDLVMAESKVNSPRGEKVSMLLQSKSKFPEDIALTLLKESLTQLSLKNNNPPAWVVSGYPRLLSEAYRFEREVGRCGLILYLWADPNVLAQRIFMKNMTCGVPTPPNLVYYLEKYHVRILPLLQTYSDRLEFIDASKIQEDVLFDILTVLERFVDNPPTFNGRSYETQWLNFKERSDLANEFLAKMPPYLPTYDNSSPSTEFIPHWWDVENSVSQIVINSEENDKIQNTRTRKDEIGTKKSTSPDSKQKSQKAGKKSSPFSSRTVSSQEIRKERKETLKSSLARKYLRKQNKRTVKGTKITRNHKSLQKISRKHSDHSQRRLSSPRRESAFGERKGKPRKSQSLISQTRSGDQVFTVNPVIRQSTMAARIINVIHADRRTPTLPASESELQEKELKKTTRSLVRNTRIAVDETPKDGMSTNSPEMNKSRSGSVRENAIRRQRSVQLVSSQDIKRMLSEVSGYSRIVAKPSRPKGEGTEDKKESRKSGRTRNSSRKNIRSNSPTDRHDKDSRCDVKRNISKHSRLLQSINTIESPQSTSTDESGSECSLNASNSSIITIAPNQPHEIDQTLNQTNTSDKLLDQPHSNEPQKSDQPLNQPHKGKPKKSGLLLDQPHKGQSHKRDHPPCQPNRDQPHKSSSPLISVVKSGSKLEINCIKTAESTDISKCKSGVSIKDALKHHGGSNTFQASEVRESTSNIKSKQQTDNNGPIISVTTFSGTESVGNVLPGIHILKTADTPKYIQIKKSVSQNQKLDPLSIKVVLNKPKTKDTQVSVMKQKSLLTSSGEVPKKCNSETRTPNKSSLTRSCVKEQLCSVVDYTPKVILNRKLVAPPKENSITSESKVDFPTKLVPNNSENQVKRDTSLNSEVIYESNSEEENIILEKQNCRTCIQETPEISSSYETKSSIGSGDVSSVSAESNDEDNSLRNKNSQKNYCCIFNQTGSKIHSQDPQSNDGAVVYATNNQRHRTKLRNSRFMENNDSYTTFEEPQSGKKSLTKISACASDKKVIKFNKELSSTSNIAIDLDITKKRNNASIENTSIKDKHTSPREIPQTLAKPKTLEVKNTHRNNKITMTDKTKDEGEDESLLRSKSSGKLASKKKSISENDTDNNKTSTFKQFSRAVILNDKTSGTENSERAATNLDVECNKCEGKKSNHESHKKNKSENSSGNFEFVQEKNIQPQDCLKVLEKTKDSDFMIDVPSKLYSELNKTKDSMPSKKVKKNSSKIIDVTSSSDKYFFKSDSSNSSVKKPEAFEETNILTPRSVKNLEKTDSSTQTKTERKSARKTTISERSNDILKPVRPKVSSNENVVFNRISSGKARKNVTEMSDVESSAEKISPRSTSSKKIESAVASEKSESVEEQNTQSRKKVKSSESVESSSPNMNGSQGKSVGKITSKKKIPFENESDLKNDVKWKENIGRVSSTKVIKTASKDLEIHSSKQKDSSSKRVSSANAIEQFQPFEQENTKARSNVKIEMSGKDISATKSKSVGRLSSKNKNSENINRSRNDSNSRLNSSTELHGDMPPSKKTIQNPHKDNDLKSNAEKNLSSKKVKSETIVHDSDSSDEKKVQPHRTVKVSVKVTSSGTDTTRSVSKSLGKISANKNNVNKGEISKKPANSKSLSKTNVLRNVSSTKTSQSSSKVQDVQVQSDKSAPKSKKSDTTSRPRISESSKEKNLPSKSSGKTKRKALPDARGSHKKIVSSKLFTKSELLNVSSAEMDQNSMKNESNSKTDSSLDRSQRNDSPKTKKSSTTTSQSKDGSVRKGEPSKTQSSVKVVQVNKCLSPRKIKSNVSGLSTAGESARKAGTLTRDTQITRPESANKATSTMSKISVRQLSSSQRDISNPSVSLTNDKISSQHSPSEIDKSLTKYSCNVTSKSNKKLHPPTRVQNLTSTEVLLKKDESSKSDSDSDVSTSRPEISLYYKLCSSIQQPPKEVRQPTLQKQPLRGKKSKSKPQWLSELPDVDETAESRQPSRENSLKQIKSISSVSSSASACFGRKHKISAKTRCDHNSLSLVSDQAATGGASILIQVSNTPKALLQPLQTRSNLFHDTVYDSSSHSPSATQRYTSPRYSSPRARRTCQKTWMPYGSVSSLSLNGSPVKQESPKTSDTSLQCRSSTSFVFFI